MVLICTFNSLSFIQVILKGGPSRLKNRRAAHFYTSMKERGGIFLYLFICAGNDSLFIKNLLSFDRFSPLSNFLFVGKQYHNSIGENQIVCLIYLRANIDHILVRFALEAERVAFF